MRFTFRWYGPDDPVELARIAQIPGIDGIVTALHQLPAGAVWGAAEVAERQRLLAAHGFEWAVAESLPVPEAVKLGLPERDACIERWIASLRTLADHGVRVICYNFMPVFDWMRTDFAAPLPDGSHAMAYAHAELERFDLSRGMARLAAWARGYSGAELHALLRSYERVGHDELHEHLAYFLRAVVPEAEARGVRLAIHPDDPPWPIFGLPRIVSNGADLRRLLAVVDSPAHCLAFCSGALAASERNDVVALAREFGARTAFAHLRNIRRSGARDFHETAHRSACGEVDMVAVLRALRDAGFRGPLRPDHGRAIWGERGIPGYGLFDRALGVTYLQGIVEALEHPGTTA